MRSFSTCIFLYFLLLFSGPLYAATLYLQEGGEVDCTKIWRDGDKVMAKINGDTIPFATNEINVKKTFPVVPKKKNAKKEKKTSVSEPVIEEVIVIDPDREKRKQEIEEEYNGYLERQSAPERKREAARRRRENLKESYKSRYR